MRPLNWEERASSRLTHVAYDRESCCIYVRFRNGTEWVYEACNNALWEGFNAAESMGRYINVYLNDRPNREFSPPTLLDELRRVLDNNPEAFRCTHPEGNGEVRCHLGLDTKCFQCIAWHELTEVILKAEGE